VGAAVAMRARAVLAARPLRVQTASLERPAVVHALGGSATLARPGQGSAGGAAHCAETECGSARRAAGLGGDPWSIRAHGGHVHPWDELQWIDEHSEQLHEARVADETLEQFAATAIQLKRDEQSRVDFLSPDHAWKWEVERGGAKVDIHERLLSMVLDKWVDRGGARPSVFRQNGRRSIRLGGYGLLGALAVQLVFDMCRTDGLAVCSSCGTPYLPPKRRPRLATGKLTSTKRLVAVDGLDNDHSYPRCSSWPPLGRRMN